MNKGSLTLINLYLKKSFIFQAKDISTIQGKVCPMKSRTKDININIDGIQESKSGGFSMDAYSMQLNQCRTVFPIKLVKPAKRFKYDEQSHINDTITDITTQFNIKNAIFDNPKRSIARCALNHASTYACEYCECAASRYTVTAIEQKKQELRKKNIENLSLIHI